MVQTSLTAWLKQPAPVIKTSTTSILPNSSDNKGDTSAPENKSCGRQQLQEARPTDQENRLNTIRDSEKSNIRPTKSQLPPNVELSSITSEWLHSFRRLNALLLPVPYTDKFYDEILNDPVAASMSLVALWHDAPLEECSSPASKPRVVAGIRCRLLQRSPSLSIKSKSKNITLCNNMDKESPSLYISTIVTLAPFRHHGLAKALLSRVAARAVDEYGVKSVAAHVWEANTEARQWYAKQGFKEIVFEDNYYRRLKPGGAWIVERSIGVTDLLSAPNTDKPFISEGEQKPG
jgi:ribosomal protein S18 acetylase RimI-like enzyme